MPGALYNPKGILLNANVPYEHVNVVLSWSSRDIVSDYNPNTHPRNNNTHVLPAYLVYDLETKVENDIF